MSNIVLVAETGSDIPQDLAKRYGIYLVPMHVSFGDEPSLDDGSFPVERICEYYSKTGTLPKTSASAPDDFAGVFDEIHSRWPEKHILHLAYSAATTSSYQSALLAAADRDYVTSIDTKQVSAGQAAVVLQMAQILENTPDMSLQDAVQAANQLCKQVHMCFLPDDLEYLRAGGRVSNVVLLGSRILNLHPCIEIIDGLLMVTKKYRGNLKKLAPRLIREYVQAHNYCKDCLYLLWAVGLDEEIKEIAENEVRACGFQEIVWIKTGCVITTHGGPGAFGLVGISK